MGDRLAVHAWDPVGPSGRGFPSTKRGITVANPSPPWEPTIQTQSLPSSLEAEAQIGAGSLRLVRLRLTLALMAMAILPLAVGAPLFATTMDSKRQAEENGVTLNAANAANAIGSTLQSGESALAKAAGSALVTAVARGDKGALGRARSVLDGVAADGSHGLVISETDDIEAAYRNIQNYTQWVEYDTKVMLTIEEAVPQIMDSLS